MKEDHLREAAAVEKKARTDQSMLFSSFFSD